MTQRIRPGLRPGLTPIRASALVLLAALAIAACGGSKTSPKRASTSASHTTTAPAVAASGHASSANIAVVNGTPITFGTYQHWMTAAETSNASEDHSSTIVPLWPPDFSGCVSEVRQKIASLKSKSTATVRKDCTTLFTALNDDTLDFLIEGVWLQDYGQAHGVTVSQAKLNSTFAADKQASFKTAAAFQTFLEQNGETTADLVFRTKINLYYKALVLAAEGATKKPTTAEQTAAEKQVMTESEAAYKAKTVCATGYQTDYCAD